MEIRRKMVNFLTLFLPVEAAAVAAVFLFRFNLSLSLLLTLEKVAFGKDICMEIVFQPRRLNERP